MGDRGKTIYTDNVSSYLRYQTPQFRRDFDKDELRSTQHPVASLLRSSVSKTAAGADCNLG
jgi:hypothetical protein